MGKKLFVLLVILMSLSLVGIIFVQAYFINNTFKNEEEQFTFNVKKALTYTSDKVVKLEYEKYVDELKKLLAQGTVPDSTDLRSILVYKQNESANQIIVYNTGVLEENFKIPSFIDIGLDSLTFSKYTGITTKQVFKNTDLDNDLAIAPDETINSIYSLNKLQMATFEAQYREEAKNTPIHLRVSKSTINELLSKKLLENNIDIDFEFSIYHKDLATKVQSDNFELQQAKLGVPIFLDNNDESEYTLYINFPERNKFILSSIIGMTLLAIIFTVIIIIAYSSALYQLIKQRQISQIKTDFINNMTHEFKTPIATINLALDAIRNPKIINDQDKVKRYLGMIKDENKRMHAQVENVLRISKLEKNELNISKERVKLHDLVTDAIAHIELIVENRNGYVKTHFEAPNCDVLANETHFTNVIVNMLDNAVKYSNDEPKIDIYTENVGNNILLKIQDQGNGMSKSVQKRVFEKFYREHTGDVHNVKGHGLGLAYVKRIVDDHQGYVSVESEKGKGSTFIIKLPLIS
ncbi:sensor histidine kinase [Pontimicrobium aquaticum]|uniref:histidine kinase n=1 Tax=Pontimicrobium aquaticum TaxID=2565367 RepID=A0A4U0F0A2_9FLAO|nr:HAMP domain-containing sensor histidine kinase [Pontimicrobium aquaticum]TJY36072.1 HAMP domain-containing histidine kinase [Pontimicrobium aquaticum]